MSKDKNKKKTAAEKAQDKLIKAEEKKRKAILKQEAKAKALAEAEANADKDEDQEQEESSKPVLKGKYVCIRRIKENGKFYAPDTEYKGDNIKRMLDLGAIKKGE